MDDRAKYATFIQFLAQRPSPPHFRMTEEGRHYVVFDIAFVDVIAKAFSKEPEQVQQDIRNYVAVANRLGVLPRNCYIPDRYLPGTIEE